jgi:hypothetical protein
MDDIIKQKKIQLPEKPKQEPKQEPKTPFTLIKWETWEYEFVPKSTNWFWTVIIITLGLALASALLSNFLFTVLVVVSGLSLLLLGIKNPENFLFLHQQFPFIEKEKVFRFHKRPSLWMNFVCRRIGRMRWKSAIFTWPFLFSRMFSGLMLSQYTADHLIVEQRILSMPASIQSIPAAADQEDFVSMGMNTALKNGQILDNTADKDTVV